MSEIDAEFLEIFRDEASERLDSIVATLLALERGEAGPDAIDTLFRDAHTIKGAAGMVGLDDVRTLAHAVEDVLADVRKTGSFPPELAEPLLRAADALRLHVEGDGAGAATADVVAELEASKDGLGSNGGASAAAEPEPGAGSGSTEAPRRSIRVPAEKLDRLLDLVGETVLHKRRLDHVLAEELSHEDSGLADELGLGDRLLGDLHDAAIGMRTLPLAAIVGGLPRAVRDIAAAEGKRVELAVTGADTELDRVILERLAEPIVHLLRNAVAHGIEKPDERERAGKPECGRVELGAEQRGAIVALTIADDGRGVAPELLAEAEREGSLADVLARAGLSTSTEVSELAGRGVGLDAVKAYVESVGGSLEIESEPGRGTRLNLLLPLTLAVLEVLLVERGPYVLGLPLASVEEVVAVAETLTLGGRSAIELRGQPVPLADLAHLVSGSAPPVREPARALVISASGRRVAALCDVLVGEEEVVVKSLSPLLGPLSGYLGSAILGDGRIALLLDPASLTRASARAAEGLPAPAAAADRRTKILVVEDSFTVRELQRGILEAAGYLVETARDGKDALERLGRDAEISLVVTDLEMPEMDGLALTRAIRSQPERAALPVVIVTTRDSEEDRRRGLEAGADAYMAKRSFDQQALLATVEQLVGR